MRKGLGAGGGAAMENAAAGEEWVNDSSVDHKRRPPFRASTGSWKAAIFIICECDRSALLMRAIFFPG
jgi:hypothetical protein